MILSAAFEDGLWGPRYQRNNKRSGLKNMRCFPCCTPEKHSSCGFCGYSVQLRIIRSYPGVTDSMRELMLSPLHGWAEFTKASVEAQSINVGDLITRGQLASLTRDRKNPQLPLYEGTLVWSAEGVNAAAEAGSFAAPQLNVEEVSALDSNTTVLAFNKGRSGWHYGWASNKYTCNEKHWLACYVFVEVDHNADNPAQRLQCIGVFHSPRFVMFCRKKPISLTKSSAPT